MTEEFSEIVTQIKLAVTACGRRIEELERKVAEERFRADANYVRLCQCKAQDDEVAELRKENARLKEMIKGDDLDYD